jgi:hypothetical protein
MLFINLKGYQVILRYYEKLEYTIATINNTIPPGKIKFDMLRKALESFTTAVVESVRN